MARTKKNATPATAPEGQQPEGAAPAVQNPAPEPPQTPQEATTPPAVQEPAPEPESPQEPPEAPEATPPDPEDQPPEDPAPEDKLPEEPEPVPPGERSLPYRATVCVSLAVVRKAVGLGTADALKPVGTLKQGAAVTVINRFEGYAQLANGLWIDEAFLAV